MITTTTTTNSTLKHVYNSVSGYFRSTTPTPPSIQPIIINLPEKTNNAYFFSGDVAAFIESTREIKHYSYTDGKLKHTFKCEGNVTKMVFNNGSFFVKCGEEGPIQAWELSSGKPIQLPETWQKISNFIILTECFVLGKPETLENCPMSLIICDPETYQPKRKISTEYFKIHDMVYKAGFLFVTGIENNPINTEVSKNGFLMRYNKLDESSERCKSNFEYDSKTVMPNVLKITPSFIYNTKWTTVKSCVWDYNTLSTAFAKKSEKNSDEPTLIKVSDYTVVVADQKEIAIYDVVDEVHIEEPPSEYCTSKELSLEQTYGTKKLSKARKIECLKSDPIKSIHIFKISEEKVLAEGYTSGKVIIRNLKTLNKMMELIPPGDMSNACKLKVNNRNKLLVHYGKTYDGTLAIVWDLTQQKPVLNITREALKNKAYDSSQDVIYCNLGNIVVQSEDQVMFYENGFS